MVSSYGKLAELGWTLLFKVSRSAKIKLLAREIVAGVCGVGNREGS